MPRRALTRSLVALLVVTAGCTAAGTSSADVTVENTDPTSYRMTVYVLAEPVGAGNVTYLVTNRTGVRKTVDGRQLETEGPYDDVTLGEEWNATERRLSIPANETTTASFDAWGPGTAVVYLFERPDGRLVRSDFAECSSASLHHTFVFSDGPENGYRVRCS